MEVYSVKSGEEQGASAQVLEFTKLQGRKQVNHQNALKITIRSHVVEAKPETQKDLFPKMLEIARKVGEKLKTAGVSIQFEINKNAGRIIIKVLDPVTGEVVRKIPPEAYMKSLEYLHEMQSRMHLQGLEVDVKY
jgi:uncharacterized FlaG/YvyC family protein